MGKRKNKPTKEERAKLRQLEEAHFNAGDRRDWDLSNETEEARDKFREELKKKYGKKAI